MEAAGRAPSTPLNILRMPLAARVFACILSTTERVLGDGWSPDEVQVVQAAIDDAAGRRDLAAVRVNKKRAWARDRTPPFFPLMRRKLTR